MKVREWFSLIFFIAVLLACAVDRSVDCMDPNSEQCQEIVITD